jgi:colanic acid biosynthesis glycosyl transferase WcaI
MMRGATMKPDGERPLNVTFVYEYAHRSDDWMMGSLIESLGARLPGLRARYLHGLFTTYRPGGLHPERLLNLAWVYLRVAFHLAFSRPDGVLVRTTPPGVQLWTVWWARFRDVPVYCWLMDYHPEMEARQLEKRGHAGAARLLRRIDARLMPRFAGIVTLDRAMAELARKRAAQVEVLEHPTWTTSGAGALAPVEYPPGSDAGTLRLAYSGNLGAAHNLSILKSLLEELARRRAVELYVVGASPSGEQRFRRVAEPAGIRVVTHARVSFARLRELYHQWRIDAGVVLLAEESAGLVSPSKFSGYINFGIPLIYVGPAGTNTEVVCTRFGGGFWLTDDASAELIAEIAGILLDAERLRYAAAGARAAASHFSNLNSESLADLLAPRLRRAAGVA